MSNLSISLPASEMRATTASTRWIQLATGVICMMAISSPQYVWTPH